MSDQHDRWRLPGGGTAEGGWGGLSPRAGNPMSWSMPLIRIAGTELRVHVIFLLLVAIELIRVSLAGRGQTEGVPLGITWTLVALLSLFIVLLIHESAHAIVARRFGGTAPEILVWPLGGLAFPLLPRSWQAHLLTALAGPAANLLLFMACGGLLWSLNGDLSAVVPDVFSRAGIMDGLLATHESWFETALFVLHWMNAIVLLVNLLPILPFDGGRALQALLWRGLGYVRAMVLTERLGFVLAIMFAIGTFLVIEGPWAIYLVSIAFFCGYVCKGMGNRVRYTEDELGRASDAGWAPVEDDADVIGRISHADGDDAASDD